jgi:methylenetetrahydrofolate dehydrogenase (NADP+) / methenyltetrahydrofolate cyclohydrolase
MIVDGKKIAEDIKAELRIAVRQLIKTPVLAVVWVGDLTVSSKYIEKKRRFAEEAGMKLRLFEYQDEIEQSELQAEIDRLVNDPEITGIIVQLPLPARLNTEEILNSIPPEKDVDALGDSPKVLSPVVGAIREILNRHQVELKNKKVAVIGQGKLVGRPVALALASEGVDVKVITKETPDLKAALKSVDVIITGAGEPSLIKPELIKEGAVIIDAGTSEASGKLRGDADPACANRCSLFTPVPGGVGPITVAMLFKNLLTLQEGKD